MQPVLICLGLGILIFFALPWSVEHKAHTLLHGLCAQRPSHTYYFGDRPLPFDARMTGIYLGFLMTFVSLLRAGAHRWAYPPTPSRIVVIAALGGVMVVDGFNSLLKDLKLPFLYEPQNWLRVITGVTAGMVLAIALCFLVASSLWREVNTRRQTLASFRPLATAIALLLPVVALVFSGWAPLFFPLTLILVFAALLVLSTLALILIVILTRRDFQYRSVFDLGQIASIALVVGALVMLALSLGRSLVEGVSGPSVLT
jgi:uncharacterized membrane protein